MITNYTNSQKNTLSVLGNGNNILLTGKPGTGKTELLKDICEHYSSLGKKIVVTGSTGMAASNLDMGRTIHSVLHWYPKGKDYDIEMCAMALQGIDLLIIDEVSMLGRSILNHLAACWDYLDRKPQIIMSGDFFQLPPVKDTMYPFENPNWPHFDLTPCILKEVVRQKEAEMLDLLEKARLGDASCLPAFNDDTSQHIIDGAICLCTLNEYADNINSLKYANLPGLEKRYAARGNNTCDADFKSTRVKEEFCVKKNMRVMALRNDSAGKYQNGSLGTVLDMAADTIKVKFDNGNVVDMGRIVYYVDNKDKSKEAVKIYQFPLITAYAISIHKSQGQTFDAVNIKAPRCWDPGQVYVALSRARSLKGMYLMDPIKESSLKTDPRVLRFYDNLIKYDAA